MLSIIKRRSRSMIDAAGIRMKLSSAAIAQIERERERKRWLDNNSMAYKTNCLVLLLFHSTSVWMEHCLFAVYSCRFSAMFNEIVLEQSFCRVVTMMMMIIIIMMKCSSVKNAPFLYGFHGTILRFNLFKYRTQTSGIYELAICLTATHRPENSLYYSYKKRSLTDTDRQQQKISAVKTFVSLWHN